MNNILYHEKLKGVPGMSHKWDPESYQSRLESKRLSATGAKDLVDRLTQTRLLNVEG